MYLRYTARHCMNYSHKAYSVNLCVYKMHHVPYVTSIKANHTILKNVVSNSIIISDCHNIYKNLALEDWIYNNLNLKEKNIVILLIWHNLSAVVIGRHQNPWIECSLGFTKNEGISVARRNSGGGTVYHDVGNLNCCFFTPRPKYDRKLNLNIICSALRNKWRLNVSISQRDDILLDSIYKISGTASKLGRNNAYHHCTVMVNVDNRMLHQTLHKELHGVDSKATTSVKSEVKNIKNVCPEICLPDVMKEVINEYKFLYEVGDENIYLINPEEEMIPGIESIEDHLKSWEWLFGMTPRFHVTRNFHQCSTVLIDKNEKLSLHLEVRVSIHRGLFEAISVTSSNLKPDISDILQQHLIGIKFILYDVETALEKWLMSMPEASTLNRYIKSCILQIVRDMYE